MPAQEKIAIENVNCPGQTVNVDAEKYRAMRRVLLKVMPTEEPGLTQTEMFQAILPHLPQRLWPDGDKSAWWAKSVQLDLEAKRLLSRTKTKPLRWLRSLPAKKNVGQAESSQRFAGYSGSPLAKKLGIKAGFRMKTQNSPDNYEQLLSPLPDDVAISARFRSEIDLWHLFTSSRLELSKSLASAVNQIKQVGMIWVSWPKRSSGLPSEITEDTVREVALPMGLVDVKVCAIDETWSGLKLVIRKQNRTK